MKLQRVLTYSDACAEIERNLALYKRLYIKKDLTARKVAESQNIKYDNNFQKALFRVIGSKNKGLGGARPGSGKKRARG